MTTQLWQAWEDVSGVKIGEMMHNWCVRQMGFPVVKVQMGSDGKSFEVEQEWFIADNSYGKDAKDKESVWTVPVIIDSNKAADRNSD